MRTRSAASSGATPFVAREHELAALEKLLAHPPAIAVIAGEAGVGKSRLVEELLDQRSLKTKAALVGHSHPLREPFPLGPVVEALRGLQRGQLRRNLSGVTGVLQALLPEIAHLLPPPPATTPDPRADRHQLYRGILDLLDAIGPAVLVLEDLHWADESTIELLTHLAASPPAHLSLVITYRQEDLSATSGLRGLLRGPAGSASTLVRLEPLDVAGAKALVEAVLGAEHTSDEFAGYLWDKTAGLPFAIEEVVRLLQSRRDVIQVDGHWERRELAEIDVPAAVRDVVLERARGLSRTTRELLDAIAVLGADARPDLLADLLGRSADDVVSGCAEAQNAALVVDGADGTVTFRHALAQQAVYEHISPFLRRVLHKRAADLLRVRAPEASDRLAHHAQQAGETQEWIGHAAAAADMAVARGDDWTACTYLRELLACEHVEGALRAELAVKLADSALHAKDHQQAIPLLRAVLETGVLSPHMEARLRVSFGWLLHQAGDVDGMYAEIIQALPHLEREPVLRVRALSALGMPLVEDRSIDDHLAWLAEAEQVARTIPDAAVGAAATIDRAFTFASIGHPHADDVLASISWHERSPAEARQLVRAHLNLAEAMYYLGQTDEVVHHLDAGQQMSDRLGYERLVIAFTGVRLRLDWAAGRWQGLDGRLIELMEGPLLLNDVADLTFLRGALSFARGRLADAEDWWRRTLAAARRTGQLHMLTAVRAGLAAVELGRGDVDAARIEADRAVALADTKGVALLATHALPTAVEVLLAQGDRSAASALVQRFDEGLPGDVPPAAAAASAFGAGLLDEQAGQDQAAAQRFAAAAHTWRSVDWHVLAAEADRARGRCLLRDGATAPSGAELLTQTMDTYAGLSATMWEDRVRKDMRDAGMAAPHRRGQRLDGITLSPRELQVARLVADGHTDRQVAQALYVSPRTASNHVANVLRKLMLPSRRDLKPELLAGIIE